MRLSTSTNIMDDYCGRPAVSVKACMEACAQAGYTVMDMNFCDHAKKNMPFASDAWEAWVADIAAYAKQLGLSFSQSHAVYYNICDAAVPDRVWKDELVRRSILASATLGVRWVVVHLGTVYEGCYSQSASLRENLAYFEPFLRLAEQCNVGIAFENSPDWNGQRCYGGSAEELCEFVDATDSVRAGICWDFGHANLTGENQCAALRKMGKRLKATHVADNYGLNDDHMLPFVGTVPWTEIMPVLYEIGYENDFTYETHKMTARIPLEARQSLLQYSVALGNSLIAMHEMES